MSRLLNTLLRHSSRTNGSPTRLWTRIAPRSNYLSSATTQTATRRTWWGIGGAVAFAAVSLSLAGSRQVHLDAPSLQVPFKGENDVHSAEDTVVDPATSIAFPKTLTIPAKTKPPTLSLVGVGVRTVSFLGIKVYSVGFYADLNNPNLKIPRDMPAEEKAKYIVENTACVIRIVPTRATSFTHLRDAFVRALQSRMAKARTEGTLTEEDAIAAGSPIRTLKSIFPNSSLAKHTPFDMFLMPPTPGRQRCLVFRDMGSIENDWVAMGLVLHYFEADGASPPLKKSVLENLESFEK